MGDFFLHNVTLITVLLAAAVGLATALMCWLLTRSLSDVPPEDREYKDPPPLGFRMTWWLLQWISLYCAPLVPRAIRIRLQTRLRRAGLDYRLSAVQFIASRDFNALYEPKGYKAEIMLPFYSSNLESFIWVGRTKDIETFGKGSNAYGNAATDANTAEGKLSARFRECSTSIARRSYRTR